MNKKKEQIEKEIILYKCICDEDFIKKHVDIPKWRILKRIKEKETIELWRRYTAKEKSKFSYFTYRRWKSHIIDESSALDKEQLIELKHYLINRKRRNERFMRVSDTFIAPLLAATVSGVYVVVITGAAVGLIEAIINAMMIVILMLVFMFQIMNLAEKEKVKDAFYADVIEVIGEEILHRDK